PRSAGDVGYALLVNAWYGPAVAFAASRRPLPFIMGQLMVFKRETLRRIGGVECAAGHLVDDMRIGEHVARASLRNVMIRWPLPLVTGGLSSPEFLRLFRRWLPFARDGLPAHFTAPNWLRGVLLYAALAAAVVAVGSDRARLLPLPLAAVAVWVASQLAL